MSAVIIDLAAERDKRESAKRDETNAHVGAALLVGAALWAMNRYAPHVLRILFAPRDE